MLYCFHKIVFDPVGTAYYIMHTPFYCSLCDTVELIYFAMYRPHLASFLFWKAEVNNGMGTI